MVIINVGGNITADAVVKVIGENTVTSFTIACNERSKTATGEIKIETSFYRCSLWNNTNAKELLYKGRSINVLGSFKVRHWIDFSNEKQFSNEVRVSFFQVFGKNDKKELITETQTAPSQPLAPEVAKEIEDDLPF